MTNLKYIPLLMGLVFAEENVKLKTPITLKAQNIKLEQVLNQLSTVSGMNVVASEISDKVISLNLNSVPMVDALDIVIRSAGLSYEVVGNSILVAEKAKIGEVVGRSATVIQLNYAKAKDVEKLIQDITKDVKVDEGGNRLLIYSSPQILQQIDGLIKKVDLPVKQVVLETRLIEVTETDGLKAGINWATLSPLSYSIVQSDPIVKYEGGVWSSGAATLQGSTAIKAVLDLLLEEGNAHLLMNTKLMTSNHKEAALLIGEEVPYTVQNVNLSSAGGGETIQKQEVGVKLQMTPHINESGDIQILVNPEISSIVSFIGKNSDLPYVRVRKTQTEVNVKAGQTVYIAGLLSEEKTKSIQKFPILGSIPLLGYLFQRHVNTAKKTNLVIEITPHIVDNTQNKDLFCKEGKLCH